MAEPATNYEEIPEPDISHLVMEDDEPVDNLYSERQQALLADALCSSWEPQRDFLTMVNVGLFYSLQDPPYVPDFLLSMDVTAPTNVREKKNKSYLIWEYGKRPDLVVEVVSNIDRHEERKLKGYSQLGIPYYVIHDPETRLSDRVVRAYELHGSRYVELVKPWFPDLEIGLTLWEGTYRSVHDSWLRWSNQDGSLLATGEERARAERQRADAQQERADAQQERADAEQKRADALAAKLRELGLDPEQL